MRHQSPPHMAWLTLVELKLRDEVFVTARFSAHKSIEPIK